MESSLEIGFLRVSEKAAIASARTMGYGKRKYSDQVAVEAMREELNRLKMRGTITIGEGERDKAPMLYVGEPLGRGWTEGEIYPEIDIVVEPTAAESVDLTNSVEENLSRMAEAFQRDVNELTIVVLDRERHHELIA